jgi:type II secretory pathway pseudopilin PulG
MRIRILPTDRDEGGYSLVELVVCVALLVTIAVAALGVLPALARQAQAGLVRDAAAEVARNAIERVRAAVAYYPAALVADPASRATVTADHRWALAASASFASAARLERPRCGAAQAPIDVPLAVTAAYDAPTDRLTVTVTYPRDPCTNGGATDTVGASATLAPGQYAPQTELDTAIGDPALQ